MRVTRGGVEPVSLAVRLAGAPDAPVVLLVHGYPDSAAVWERVGARLADRFRVVRPDVRGSGESTAPADRDGYRLDELVDDLVAVADAAAPGRPVHLVGHDWGAVQGWEAVTRHPDRFATFTSISGPGLDHVGHWFRTGPRAAVARQAAMSWYVALFRAPVLPELVWRVLGPRWPHRTSSTVVRDAVHGLELYRANVAARLRDPRPAPVRVPVQLVVPRRDRYVSPALADSALPWAADLTRVELAAGHWAPLSHPDTIAGLISGFAARECLRSPERP